MKRRLLLGCLAALPLAQALGRPGIVQRPLTRVIVDNDFAGDPDGLVALAHQLLAPATRTVLVTASALDPGLARMAGLDPERTARDGARRARALLRLAGPGPRPPVVADGAAQAIVDAALRDDPLPLVLACGGPLTNVAAALRLRPAIAERMRLVWIGGTAAGDHSAEYNLATDVAAARFVLEETRIPVLQIPAEEYRRFQVSVATLNTEVAPLSPLARWLVDQYRHLPPFVRLGGTLTFGDSPLVTATAFDPAATPFATRTVGDREIRMAHSLDPQLNFADFTALLRAHARRA
jgi:hypothetical protein